MPGSQCKKMSVCQLNSLSLSDFLLCLGDTSEHSMVMVSTLYFRRPFASRRDVVDKMEEIVDQMPFCMLQGLLGVFLNLFSNGINKVFYQRYNSNTKNQLIKDQLDIPDKVNTLHLQLSASSTSERKMAGLDNITAKQKERMDELDQRYVDKFGFPFVICARLNSVDTIIQELSAAIHRSLEEEVQRGIGEYKKIFKLRLEDKIQPDDEFPKSKL